jgi:hypothetical protein
MTPPLAAESATLAFIRRLLLASLAVGVAGTAGELILLGHIDSPAQWIPLIALGAVLPLLLWHALRPAVTTVRGIQWLMCAFIVSGVAGIWLHYDGNVEFERELHPKDTGVAFLRHTVAGATPVLAPGSMVLLGLIGIAHTYRHPRGASPVRLANSDPSAGE